MKSAFLGASLFFLCALSFAQDTQTITGRVTQMGQPLPNVNILIDQTEEGTYTNSSGLYKIEVEPGSTLKFTHAGLRTISIITEDVTEVLNIEMEPFFEELEGVTVTRKKLSPQQQLAKEYPKNKRIVKTRFGFRDTNRSGSRITIIDEERDKISTGLDLTTVIERRFFGTIDKDDPLNPKFYEGRVPSINEVTGDRIRIAEEGRNKDVNMDNGTKAMIFDVDGQIFENFPIHLMVDNIDRIAIIPGHTAANTYSMRARGGVIVINTKGANLVYEKGTDKVYDYERLRSNFYVDDTTAIISKGNVPQYMLELKKAINKEEGLKIYNEQRSRYGKSPYFELNVANYFLKDLNEQRTADSILVKVSNDFSKNPVVLKALAFLSDERQEWEQSTELYKQILRLRPRYAQSYRDLGNSFVRSGAYGKALGMYLRYEKIKEGNPTLNQSSGIDEIMESEYENISALYGHEFINNENAQKETIVWGARVLVEWNNSEAEFELQVIHPNTQFFTINHTISGNPQRIENEKIKGYSSEQIWFDYNDAGTWNINLKYLGNKSYDPTYFKITLFRDWGLPTQSKEIKVYRMEEKYRNRNVLRFKITGKNSQ